MGGKTRYQHFVLSFVLLGKNGERERGCSLTVLRVEKAKRKTDDRAVLSSSSYFFCACFFFPR